MCIRDRSYEVTVVDKFLNRSQALVLDPIKLTGNGLQDLSLIHICPGGGHS